MEDRRAVSATSGDSPRTVRPHGAGAASPAAPRPIDRRFDAKSFLAALRRGPGVYRMYDAVDRLIYVGKARDVRRRLASYFGRRPTSSKVAALLRHLARVEVTFTANEVEALLLESNLIKRHRPRYNVVLRDDKSYPYIRIEGGLGFPRLSFYRGPRRSGTKMYGPYPSAGAARTTLAELQRVFHLRNCSDRYFMNRTRPCLQHQIERCSAPCVGYIGTDEYAEDLAHAVDFLEGHDETVIDALVERMEDRSRRLEFETAARIRDQIQRLRQIRARQDVVSGVGDCDVLALAQGGRTAVVTALPVRAGRVLGSRNYLLRIGVDEEPEAVLESFIAQHYLEDDVPPLLVVDHSFTGSSMLAAALEASAGHRVRISTQVRGTLRRLLALAAGNAREALATREGSNVELEARFGALERVLDLPPGALARIECFDISHTGGESAIGSLVVFDRSGPLKNEYRRYRVREAALGDDYAALAEVLRRRYGRLVAENAALPDLVLVDGGSAHVRRAARALAEVSAGAPRLAGVVKGPGRRPQLDRLVLGPEGRATTLPADSPALLLVQRLRDEAHRFAIGGHRSARARRRRESVLDEVPGIGPVRRRQLLSRFGGLKGLQRASTADLEAIPGVSRALALRIVERLAST